MSKTVKLLSSIVKAMFLKKTAQGFEEFIYRNVLELSIIIIIIMTTIIMITDIIIIMNVIIIVIVTMIVVIIKV